MPLIHCSQSLPLLSFLCVEECYGILERLPVILSVVRSCVPRHDELARPVKLVCSDLDASIGASVSVNQCATVARRTGARRLAEGYEDLEDRKHHLLVIVPDLNERQLEKLANNHQNEFAGVEECAPNYSKGCLFDKVGTCFRDFQ